MRPGLGRAAFAVLLVGIVAGVIIVATGVAAGVAAGTRPLGAADDSPLSTDQAFFAAVARSDRAGAVKLLDADFTWTDAAGRTLNRTQLLKLLLPKPAETAGQGLEDKHYNYGDVAVLETDRGKIHTLRIWIKRPAGWRGIVYQEVRSLEGPAGVIPGVTRDCLNPCREIPYTPRTSAQKSVLSAYKAFASAAVARNTAAWGSSTADEFVVVSSNSERPTDKKTAIAQLARTGLEAVSPTLVVSAEMFDFPGAVVMRSEQQPEHGKPLHVTRLWIERGGRWVIALSYQTSISEAQAAP